MVKGGTLQFTAYGVYSDGSVSLLPDSLGNAVTLWNTSNHALAKVSSHGHVTAMGTGKVDIEAVIGSLKSSPWTVTVSGAAQPAVSAAPPAAPAAPRVSQGVGAAASEESASAAGGAAPAAAASAPPEARPSSAPRASPCLCSSRVSPCYRSGWQPLDSGCRSSTGRSREGTARCVSRTLLESRVSRWRLCLHFELTFVYRRSGRKQPRRSGSV